MTEKKKILCLAVTFLMLSFCWIVPAIAGDIYSITFSEGYYPQISGKFGALVIVGRSPCRGCDGVELGRFRGSTLPNAYGSYKDARGNPIWRDGQIQRLYAALRTGPYNSDAQSIAPILGLFNDEWPIMNGGEYSFMVKASSVFTPRGLQVNEGTFVRLESPRPTDQYSYLTKGIWIHKGIYSGQRGAEGCLTVHPDDWDRFIALFPSETEWVSRQATGVLWIIRLLGEGQEPPSAIKASISPSLPSPSYSPRPSSPGVLNIK